MKIRDNRKKTTKKTNFSEEVPIGTVFSGEITTKGIYLKSYNSIIDLNDPSATWTDTNVEIIDYCALDVTLVINKQLDKK